MRKTLQILIAALLLCLSAAVGAETPPAADSDYAIFDELWVQVTADYRANCYQTYNSALLALTRRDGLEVPARNAQGQRLYRFWLAGRPQDRPLAIIMDLDETVIDNSAYQAFMALANATFHWESWEMFLNYQADHPSAWHAVPGAVDFVHQAQDLGYTVIFISNRTEEQRAITLKVLRGLGLKDADLSDRLFLDPGEDKDHAEATKLLARMGVREDSPEGRAMVSGEGRKERRRQQIRERFYPIIYIGDDMGDFFSFVKAGEASVEENLKNRRQAVDDLRAHWGRDWFVLPNPMYGNWGPGRTLPKVGQGLKRFLRDDGFFEFYQNHKKS